MPKALQHANNEKSKIAQNRCNLQYERAIGYFHFCRKIIKNVSNILLKLASKTTLQIEAIWEPTWLDFGRVLAPQLEPNWHPDALKPIQQRIKKMITSWIDFGPILARFWPPTWP